MANLAINGGTPVAPNGLQVNWPIFGELEEKFNSRRLPQIHRLKYEIF